MNDDFLGVAFNYNQQVIPTPGINLDLGHIGIQDLIGISDFRIRTINFSFYLVTVFSVHQKILIFHRSINSLFIKVGI